METTNNVLVNAMIQAGEIAQGIPHFEVILIGVPVVLISVALLTKGQLFNNW